MNFHCLMIHDFRSLPLCCLHVASNCGCLQVACVDSGWVRGCCQSSWVGWVCWPGCNRSSILASGCLENICKSGVLSKVRMVIQVLFPAEITFLPWSEIWRARATWRVMRVCSMSLTSSRKSLRQLLQRFVDYSGDLHLDLNPTKLPTSGISLTRNSDDRRFFTGSHGCAGLAVSTSDNNSESVTWS